MKNANKIQLLLALILCLSLLQTPGSCQDGFILDGVTFDYIYKRTIDGKNEEEIRYLSNGKGVIRYFKTRGKNTDFVLYDFKNKVMTVIFSDTKKYTEFPFSSFKTPPLQMDEETIKADSQYLGKEKKDGIDCHKYNRNKGLARGTYWISDKTHFLVHCRIKAENQTNGPETEMSLKSCNLDKPDDKMFAIPEDCQKVILPGKQP